MEIVLRFVNILAWAGCFGFGFWGTLGLCLNVVYIRPGNLFRARDILQGVTREFRWHRHFLVAAICAAWIVAAGAY